MTALAPTTPAARAAPPLLGSLDGPLTRAAVAALGFVSGVMAATVVLRSDHEDSRAWTAAFVLFVGWSFVGSGLVAWARRPDNGVGRLMVVTGFVSLLGALSAAETSLPFTIGVALGSAGIALFAHLLLAYPAGRLVGRLERGLAAALYADLVGLQVLWLLFADLRATGCDECVSGGLHEPAGLAENAFLLHSSNRLAEGIDALQNGAGIVLALAVTGLVVRRWRTATPLARRALAPVLVTGALAVVLFLVVSAALLVEDDVAASLRWIALGAYGTVPLAFLVGLLQSRLARIPAGRLLLETREDASLRELEEALRRALGDPTLRLALWLEDEQYYIGAGGEPLALPAETGRRAVTRIASEGRPLAALVHDASLRSEPEFLNEVVATARMTFERDRGLRALRASEARNRALIKALPDLLLRIGGDGRYLAVKPAVDGTLPVIPADELVGRSVEEVLPPEAAARFMAAVRRALMSGGTATVEYQLDVGGRHDFEARIVPSGDDEVVAIVRDFTELHRLQEELEAKLAELAASRARIVEVGTAERRRLERNLHDGAQQRLLATSLMLRVACSRLDSDVGSTRALLAQATEELAAALEELRELARGIHPAILTDRGLGPAIDALATRSPIAVECDVQVRERLPPPVEAAAYFVVAEGLTNVAKYAHASHARVRIRMRGDEVEVVVRDDGVGGADAARGTGLRGLADRVAALDGELTLDSPPGRGTRLAARIPVRRAEERL